MTDLEKYKGHPAHMNLENPDRTIVLIGLMGVGKSTIGRRLALRLGLGFVDADEEIERAAGRTVSEIFESFGEAAFRDGERKVIARLIEGPAQVIATGGGAFIDAETRRLILKRSISIWLDADIDVLVERTARRDTRPLLKSGDPRSILVRLWQERSPQYAKADLHIKSSDGPHEQVVDQIVKALQGHIRESSNR
nr:shikimate kinase [Iodidimonas gelatinilytica]